MAMNDRRRWIADCPDCGASVSMKHAEVGERVECPECGEELEVIRLRPPKLDYVYGEEGFEEEEDEEEVL